MSRALCRPNPFSALVSTALALSCVAACSGAPLTELPPSSDQRLPPPEEASGAPVSPAAQVASNAARVDAPQPQPETARPELLTECTDKRAIVVRKKRRTLELRCGDALAARYEISLGNAPVGRKQREGDGRTPEGDYYITMKYPSRFHRTMRLAFPNIADADDGLASGAITSAQRAEIVKAYAQCKEPPQTTALGSLIEIHGAGGGPDDGDWTLGCIALDNDRIEQVFAFHEPGCGADGLPKTPVRILP